MKRAILSMAAVAMMVPAVAMACDGDMKASAPIKSYTVQQLAQAKQAKIYDANNQDFREKNGTIPGAVLLTNYKSYDPAKELPTAKDSEIVFYCASTKCSASHEAADRALKAGYTNVAVMPDGLLGWKAAGNKVAPIKPQS
jgi:rhodanese-related sulfurtransferase